MPACIGAVTDNTIDEFGNTIDNTGNGKDGSKTRITDSILFIKQGNGKREIFSDKVKHGIAYHGADNNSPLPILE